MIGLKLFCGSEKRRGAVKDHKVLNGIDYLEVLPAEKKDQLPLLILRFFKPVETSIGKENLVIKGGIRIRDIKIEWVLRADSEELIDKMTASEQAILSKTIEPQLKSNFLVIRPITDGDFSRYSIQIILKPDNEEEPPKGFDPILSKIDFTFKVQCAGDFDCKVEQVCPPVVLQEPLIDYMAKDFESFRLLTLNRLSAIMPDWKEKHSADIVSMLVEIMAYVGDHLSYFQDAVATEAYLGTALKRISLRRHARLLDYKINEGCNSRVLICFEVEQNGDGIVPVKTRLITGVPDSKPMITEDELNYSISQGSIAFETLFEAQVYSNHNVIQLYTWGDSNCCLPKGATSATLIDTGSGLKIGIGSILLFEELQIEKNDNVNPTSRKHAVRLTDVKTGTDPLTNTSIINVAWGIEDALPFPFCVEGYTEGGEKLITVARGNIVIADHGYTIRERLVNRYGHKYRPILSRKPLTHSIAFDSAGSVYSSLNFESLDAEPDIFIYEPRDGSSSNRKKGQRENGDKHWASSPDLLSSDAFARNFIVEMENDGTAQIRFGDGKYGMSPNPSTDKSSPVLNATYRIGSGTEGNVGAFTICQMVAESLQTAKIRKIWNPMPAKGGTDPEKTDEIIQNAPEAFRIQERAVTETDYVDILERHPEIQKATAILRWTGSWHTVYVTLDRYGGKTIDSDFKKKIQRYLDNKRLAGYDVEIGQPLYVPLELDAEVCIDSEHIREQVKKELLNVFSNHDMIDGRRGFFHPDNFTFGKPVFLSKIYELIMKVEGVVSVDIKRFRRLNEKTDHSEDGVIKLGIFEIVRLDNDPNYPENGKMRFSMRGGR